MKTPPTSDASSEPLEVTPIPGGVIVFAGAGAVILTTKAALKTSRRLAKAARLVTSGRLTPIDLDD